MARPLSTPGKDPVPLVQEAGWAPGPVWTGAENLAATGIRSPDRDLKAGSIINEVPRSVYDCSCDVIYLRVCVCVCVCSELPLATLR
jgi:hypothetical protein